VTPGTGLHPRPAPADALTQYFPRAANELSATGTTANASYIDPRWEPTYLVTRKGESVSALHARCEEFLRAFIGRVEGRRPSQSSSTSTSTLPAGTPGTPGIASAGSASQEGQELGVSIGHERILLVSHAGTIIALTHALTGDDDAERSMRVGCCTLTTLRRTPSSFPPAGSSSSSSSFSPPPTVRDVIGNGVWTVSGTLADGSFLSGGVERSWGMMDIETFEGVVVEDPGIPGSENEEDGPNGLQAWWQTAAVPSPKM
jgi:transcription factor C subunit 7